jgi:glycosyltransferase involved in cell wall biosynthesis
VAEGRVLQLLGPSTGGIRRHVAELSRRLEERGWAVDIAGPPGVLDGATVVPVPAGFDPRGVVAAWRALAPLVAGVDVVHAHGLKAAWVASLLRRPRPPIVATVHNLVLDEVAGRAAGKALRVLEGVLPRRVDELIAVSQPIADRFGRGVVVPPVGPAPVVMDDLRRPGCPLVVAVARLHPQKDLATLIRAAARLPEVSVEIVGEGPLQADLQVEIDRRRVGDRVRLTGPSTNSADHLAAADVVAVTSIWESGPLALAEALLLGRPVVTTPVGFAPSLVEDGVSGRVVPVGDDRAVAAAIAELLDDPARAAAMGEAGQQRARQLLDPDRLVSSVEDVYQGVLNR